MAEPAIRERLRPSLLDRLTDHAPESPRDRRDARGLSEPELREQVRRDLSWLLNATQLASVASLADYPEVARSVLNFGICDLAGRTRSSVDEEELEALLREAICSFEPRLLPDSVSLRVSAQKADSGHAALVIDIEGELWAEPLPVALYLRSEIDLEAGHVRVEERRPDGGR